MKMIKSNMPPFDKVGVDFYCIQYLCLYSLDYIYIGLTDQVKYTYVPNTEVISLRL
jgi:hypothetical protein